MEHKPATIDDDDTKRWFALGFEILYNASVHVDGTQSQFVDLVNRFAMENGLAVINTSTISCLRNHKAKSFPGYKMQETISRFFGKIGADEVIAIGRDQERDPNYIVTQQEHMNLIPRFRDQILAYKINKRLLSLEDKDPALLRRVLDMTIENDLWVCGEEVSKIIDLELYQDIRKLQETDKEAYARLKRYVKHELYEAIGKVPPNNNQEVQK
jgi:hypothetical protein